ncbi:outer membrane lipoprotein LolB [Marinomonas piezotolerans]|uniref:Outer-membrane lipoprotein LolB n=1 Tax=Marinomonas piezotolerans TaxID=2213058 RepID=A0A370U743_9GAMM|nr:lipoprotein insertase outer membrane protein LolB [Marinomonas piezotolerans]RDL43582.1 outer membrane lipoprotein LolB [Marinomonas piezotolerans]
MKTPLIIVFVTAILAGCSTTPSVPPEPTPERTEDISAWQTEGRVGIRTENDAISGNFYWNQSQERYELNIYGPFGQGATRLEGSVGQSAQLSYDDKTIVGKNAEELLYSELGWQFPVTQVQYWIRGLASPKSYADITYDVDGSTPKQIYQDGWTITYKEFTSIDHLKLPQKMQVTQLPYRVNLIITSWDVQ